MIATGVGSLPGDDFAEAVKTVLGELDPDRHGLPFLPELPGRGVYAGMLGRTLGLLASGESWLDADLQPAGWRLTGTTGSSGRDQRRAASRLAQDLDVLEEVAQGYVGPFKIQVAGPWTLAATVERPRGDKVLGDLGARRELAQALAESVRGHVADVRRRLPGLTRLVVQVDEPALRSVLDATVRTASGYATHRNVDLPVAAQALEWVLGAVSESGAEPWVHLCSASPPVALAVEAGATGISVDLDLVGAAELDALGEAWDTGHTVALGVVAATDVDPRPTGRQLEERVTRLLDMLGFDPDELGDRLVLTPTCGLAGATPGYARVTLALLAELAR